MIYRRFIHLLTIHSLFNNNNRTYVAFLCRYHIAYRTSRNFSESKIWRFKQKIDYQNLARSSFGDFGKFKIKHCTSKRVYCKRYSIFREPKNLTNNAKIHVRSSLKFLLIRYIFFKIKIVCGWNFPLYYIKLSVCMI